PQLLSFLIVEDEYSISLVLFLPLAVLLNRKNQMESHESPQCIQFVWDVLQGIIVPVGIPTHGRIDDVVLTVAYPFKNSCDDTGTDRPFDVSKYPIASIEISSMQLGDFSSGHSRQLGQQAAPILFSDMHSLRIDKNADHYSYRLVSGTAFVAITEFHGAIRNDDLTVTHHGCTLS